MTKVDRVPRCITRFRTGTKIFTEMFTNCERKENEADLFWEDTFTNLQRAVLEYKKYLSLMEQVMVQITRTEQRRKKVPFQKYIHLIRAFVSSLMPRYQILQITQMKHTGGIPIVM
eukprot:6923253-Ditylum_brightwellii.AAC.1